MFVTDGIWKKDFSWWQSHRYCLILIWFVTTFTIETWVKDWWKWWWDFFFLSKYISSLNLDHWPHFKNSWLRLIILGEMEMSVNHSDHHNDLYCLISQCFLKLFLKYSYIWNDWCESAWSRWEISLNLGWSELSLIFLEL